MKACIHCRAQIAEGARFCQVCGRPQQPPDDGIAQVIPTRNVPALVGYYLGVFSIIPCFPIGIAALVLGIIGLRRYHATPHVHGRVHAWVGILAGGLFGTLWLLATLLPFIAAAVNHAHGR